MAVRITEAQTAQIKDDAYVLVTQKETVNGAETEVLRRVKKNEFNKKVVGELKAAFTNLITLLEEVRDALKNGDIDRAIDLLDTFLIGENGGVLKWAIRRIILRMDSTSTPASLMRWTQESKRCPMLMMACITSNLRRSVKISNRLPAQKTESTMLPKRSVDRLLMRLLQMATPSTARLLMI